MNRFWTILALILTTGLAALLPAAPARAQLAASRGINDAGTFFSPEAEARAKQVIDQIFDKHHGKEVLIETFNDLPGGQSARDYGIQRATAAKLNGLYIGIVRKGGQVVVLPDSKMRAVFTDAVANELDQKLTTDLRKGPPNFDTALANAMQFVNDRITQAEKPGTRTGGAAAGGAGAGSTASPRSQGGGGLGGGTGGPVPGPTPRTAPTGCGILPGGLMGWVCLIAGAWMIFGLVRGIFRRRNTGYGGPGYQGGPGGGGYGGGPVAPGYGGGYGGGGMMGGGGGGWGTSILGGLFGAAAGNWMYDRFARGGGSAYGQAPPTDPGAYGGGAAAGGGGAGEPGWAQTGGDFSGGGGSTYSDPSGQDFGSGGGGGADFGGGGAGDFGGGGGFSDAGGDFGGGGSDFGGGGGDFGGGSDT